VQLGLTTGLSRPYATGGPVPPILTGQNLGMTVALGQSATFTGNLSLFGKWQLAQASATITGTKATIEGKLTAGVFFGDATLTLQYNPPCITGTGTAQVNVPSVHFGLLNFDPKAVQLASISISSCGNGASPSSAVYDAVTVTSDTGVISTIVQEPGGLPVTVSVDQAGNTTTMPGWQAPVGTGSSAVRRPAGTATPARASATPTATARPASASVTASAVTTITVPAGLPSAAVGVT